MVTPEEWWREVKTSPTKFVEWLQKQYVGEVTAVRRIDTLILTHLPLKSAARIIVTKIIDDEKRHAEWIGDLLKFYMVKPAQVDTGRYWSEVLRDLEPLDLPYRLAIAAHAETMRLARIEVIAADPETPENIREVFQKIFYDENFHANAFESLAGEEAMEQARSNHCKGMEALGLVI